MISESPTQWNRALAVQMAKGKKQPKTKGLNRLTKAKIFSIIQLTGNLMLEQSRDQQLASPCPQQIHPNSEVWRNCLCASSFCVPLPPPQPALGSSHFTRSDRAPYNSPGKAKNTTEKQP